MKKAPSLYLNLIIENLPASVQFYKALGFVENMDFSDEKAACMMWKSDFAVMLLTKDFAHGFLPERKKIAPKNTTCSLYALEFPSKEAVDSFLEKALNAGGQVTKDYDY